MRQRRPISRTPVRAATCALLAGVALVLIVACGPGPTNDAPTPTGDISITVTVIGDGRATFAGLDFTCGATCTLGVDEGTDISLEAIPNAGRVLVAWDGPCSPFDDTCEWQAEAGTAVTVTFAPHALRFDLEGDGQGTFQFFVGETGTFIECGAACGLALGQPQNISISHQVAPDDRTELEPWDADCIGEAHDNFCVVNVEGVTVVGKAWRHAPIASPQAYATPQETPRSVGAPGVLTGVDDTPGDTHTASVEAEPEHGTLTLAPSGAFTYEPNAGFAGLDTFTFLVTDAFGNTDKATATMTVHPRLTLEKQGAGTVTSEPSGIDCDVGCTSDAAIFDFDSSVTLTASPASSATFVSWSGDACDGSSNPTCDVPMNGPKNITATFRTSTYTLDVSRTGDGTGTITSTPAGINVTTTQDQDSATFDQDQPITLTANPASNSDFDRWTSGPCNGSTSTTCTFTITSNTTITAAFDRKTYTLDVSRSGAGNGNVVSTPRGINLSNGDDSATFAYGTEITLTATASGITSVFAEWSTDPCAGSSVPICTFTITADTSVDATFDRRGVFALARGSVYGNAVWNPERIDRAGATPASRSSAPLTLRSRWSLTS